jgi:hypothetical protein
MQNLNSSSVKFGTRRWHLRNTVFALIDTGGLFDGNPQAYKRLSPSVGSASRHGFMLESVALARNSKESVAQNGNIEPSLSDAVAWCA